MQNLHLIYLFVNKIEIPLLRRYDKYNGSSPLRVRV